MTDQPVGICTGFVIAVRNKEAAAWLWRSQLGFGEGLDGTTLTHPDTRQSITLVELNHADPAISLAVRCRDVELSLTKLRSYGFREYWREVSAIGTRFVMCRDEIGVFVLLYQEP